MEVIWLPRSTFRISAGSAGYHDRENVLFAMNVCVLLVIVITVVVREYMHGSISHILLLVGMRVCSNICIRVERKGIVLLVSLRVKFVKYKNIHFF